MSNQNKSNLTNYILAFIFTAIMVYLLVVLPAAFWIVLPFSVTYIAKSLDLL